MTNVVRSTLVEKKQELKARADMLRLQWQAVKDDQAARKGELDQIDAELADVTAWLAANP